MNLLDWLKFFFFTDEEAKKARVIVSGKTFQPSLIFVSKARTYPRGASLRCLLHTYTALHTDTSSGWKGLPETNTLAYSASSLICFVILIIGDHW